MLFIHSLAINSGYLRVYKFILKPIIREQYNHAFIITHSHTYLPTATYPCSLGLPFRSFLAWLANVFPVAAPFATRIAAPRLGPRALTGAPWAASRRTYLITMYNITYIYICECVRESVCMYVCMYVCVCVCADG